MKIEISNGEITAIMAAEFVLRNSKERKKHAVYFQNVIDEENTRVMDFDRAEKIIVGFIQRLFDEGVIK